MLTSTALSTLPLGYQAKQAPCLYRCLFYTLQRRRVFHLGGWCRKQGRCSHESLPAGAGTAGAEPGHLEWLWNWVLSSSQFPLFYWCENRHFRMYLEPDSNRYMRKMTLKSRRETMFYVKSEELEYRSPALYIKRAWKAPVKGKVETYSILWLSRMWACTERALG